VLGASIITSVGEGRRGDAQTEQGEQCHRGRKMSTRASPEREANWTTGIHHDAPFQETDSRINSPLKPWRLAGAPQSGA